MVVHDRVTTVTDGMIAVIDGLIAPPSCLREVVVKALCSVPYRPSVGHLIRSLGNALIRQRIAKPKRRDPAGTARARGCVAIRAGSGRDICARCFCGRDMCGWDHCVG